MLETEKFNTQPFKQPVPITKFKNVNLIQNSLLKYEFEVNHRSVTIKPGILVPNIVTV